MAIKELTSPSDWSFSNSISRFFIGASSKRFVRRTDLNGMVVT